MNNKNIYQNLLIFLTIALIISIGILWLSVRSIELPDLPVRPSVIKQAEGAMYEFNPCDLKDVICDYERRSEVNATNSGDGEHNDGVSDVVVLGSKDVGTRIIYAEVTQYTKIETCPNHECKTANGTSPKKGHTAACPRSIPLGTKVSVGGRIVICSDRTGRRLDGRFDLYNGDSQKDYREAIEWGIKKLPIIILN